MSETCFSFGEERRRHQLHGAPREQTIEGRVLRHPVML